VNKTGPAPLRFIFHRAGRQDQAPQWLAKSIAVARHAASTSTQPTCSADSGEDLHPPAGVLMRNAVLNVNYAHHAIARDHGSREKSFERILRQLAERFETLIVMASAGDRQQFPLAGHPTG